MAGQISNLPTKFTSQFVLSVGTVASFNTLPVRVKTTFSVSPSLTHVEWKSVFLKVDRVD
mgnify:CR=1 FL=1